MEPMIRADGFRNSERRPEESYNGFEENDREAGAYNSRARSSSNSEASDAVGCEPEYDEFGRLVPVTKKEPVSKKTEEWPPCFCDKHSVDYVLDARSGMFYHAGCEFFFDPKSKLYYGNKQKSYFRHMENSTSRYVPVDAQDVGTTGHVTGEPEALLDSQSRPTSSSTASTISIKLKTKKLPTKKKPPQSKHTRERFGSTTASNSSDSPLSASVSVASKHQRNNIEKWQERRQELATTDSTGLVSKQAVTKSGEPVCLLCKRKFQTMEQLGRHEQLSQMHKDNLLRVKSAEQQQATHYVDRAQNRRQLHGDTGCDAVIFSDAGVVAPNPQMESLLPKNQTEATFDPLGDQNLGRKMLQGMGWKHDAGDQHVTTHEGLAKEWDRIEQQGLRGK